MTMNVYPYPESYWLASAPLPSYPSLQASVDAEVAVIGGGIAGITTAYLLARAGKQVVLATAGKLLGGTTGHTTAKITAQHDLIYADLIRRFGEEQARLYYEANAEGLRFMRETVRELGIDCDFRDEEAIVYATCERQAERLRAEYEAYAKLGIPGEWRERLALPFAARGGLAMKDQARFHPVPYLAKLAEAFVRLGGRIYEETTIETVEEGEPSIAVTADGAKIACENIVSCAHFPVFETGLFFARLHAESSYVVAARVPGEHPKGMYISAGEPKRSIRSVAFGGEELLLIGGETHKTGQGINTVEHYEALEAWARETFGAAAFPYRWSANDFITLDRLPYIGRATRKRPHSFVATGFRKWGMTTGTAAALLLRDLLTGRSSRYEALFAPSRFHAPDVKPLVAENAGAAKHYIQGKLEWLGRKPEELNRDEGALVRVNGRKAGAYVDADGTLHLVDATCTHMGCEVEWNSGDRTWDCPCHGSRFDYRGRVAEGPATEPLSELRAAPPVPKPAR
ncbi:FAD-dependent oxidoreductase [Paenibacillus sp. MWE-103]|uniref:FAD-dependent oxidoreductase n=1 Tax=Paenibacillus artemisiicola TaxID=1172618 RepID=A0ABS3W321_9BACL|nr:FAD-dependent oxidoreductase [Paenibacillus artemisiicola]MBO7742694.1 FAD-dependent oxidoreductase [Paenibacillus artemisiicola]